MKNQTIAIEEFTAQLAILLDGMLDDTYTVQIQSVNKTNDNELIGLRVSKEGVQASIQCYSQQPYSEYENGRDIEDIATAMCMQAVECLENEAGDVAFALDKALEDYETLKSFLSLRVLGEEFNKEYLEDKVSFPLTSHDGTETGLVAVVSADVRDAHGGFYSAVFTEELIKALDVDEKQVCEDAKANAPNISPYVFGDMMELMISPSTANMLGTDRGVNGYSMLVLSNEDIHFGANVLANEEVLQEVYEKMGGEFYIIPSSVSEVLVVNSDESVESLKEIISEVNDSVLQAELLLSYSLFAYDTENGLRKVA